MMSPLRALVGLALLLALAGAPAAQHALTVRVTDEHSGAPLTGATVVFSTDGTPIGASADADGLATLTGLPAGDLTLTVSFIGYQPATVRATLPRPDGAPIEVALEEDEEALDDVVVSATRTSRTIADLPTRVETIAGEEIDEKVSMDPSNITMLLNESPGIVVQQTSAVSGNASIRIQGLDGRYTQLLKDGFPLYGGFSGGLSILQVPPLDLRQVEVIKGPASTLYGAGAIAGLVNLVSREPRLGAPERSVLLNVTSAGGVDVGSFLSGRNERLGYTLLASANGQGAYDGDGDAFTNLPRTRRLTVAPRIYAYLSDATTLWGGLSGTVEDREGGDVAVIEDGAAGYTEHSESARLTSQLRLDHAVSEAVTLTAKQSTSLFDRRLALPDYRFEGDQLSTYAEASALVDHDTHDVVVGLDLRTDAFDQRDAVGPELDDDQFTVGAFVQDTRDIGDRVAVELGLRGDWHDTYGVFVLPRASALVRVAEGVALRATAGLGYQAPTVFLEPSEARAFRSVAPLDETVRAETSAGGTVDLNLRTVLGGRVTLSLNQAVFATRLDDALVPAMPQVQGDPDVLRYQNADGPVWSRGTETNARFGLGDLKLFLGYVYLQATEAAIGPADGIVRRRVPLTPAHKTYSVLVWERHGQGRIGLEAYYTSAQDLPDGGRTDGYWVTGLMGEWRVGPARVFLNLENLLDTQQTNYGPVVLGPRGAPTFADLWAPTDGFIANGGVKLSL
ncbi:TonB-dependent receptor [Rubrivirga sp. IMCC43871]|uniref:TonB-dependent receptor n=1 Tax=Rubrivirga sp. IMCC43871 TaxID=3391575 RepID=UPI0039902106